MLSFAIGRRNDSHLFVVFFNDTATTEIYTLSLHDALPIWMPAPRACSTTMRLATEPRMVRFPASVEAIASRSHARVGSPKVGITVLKSSTAGTLETRFESTAVTTVSTEGR